MMIEPNPDESWTFRYSGFVVDAIDYMAQAFDFT